MSNLSKKCVVVFSALGHHVLGIKVDGSGDSQQIAEDNEDHKAVTQPPVYDPWTPDEEIPVERGYGKSEKFGIEFGNGELILKKITPKKWAAENTKLAEYASNVRDDPKRGWYLVGMKTPTKDFKVVNKDDLTKIKAECAEDDDLKMIIRRLQRCDVVELKNFSKAHAAQAWLNGVIAIVLGHENGKLRVKIRRDMQPPTVTIPEQFQHKSEQEMRIPGHRLKRIALPQEFQKQMDEEKKLMEEDVKSKIAKLEAEIPATEEERKKKDGAHKRILNKPDFFGIRKWINGKKIARLEKETEECAAKKEKLEDEKKKLEEVLSELEDEKKKLEDVERETEMNQSRFEIEE
jgi:hypothetical protein